MKRFDTSDGLSLTYLDDGAGLPVLCLAGLTRNTADFDDLAGALDREVRLIRLNTRGRGGSDWAKDAAGYSVPVEARDALELLDHLGIAKALVIGTSRGGLIAMFLAATAKDRLLGVVLNDIGPVLDQSGLKRIVGYVGQLPPARNYVEAARHLSRTFGDHFPDVSETRWAIYAERWYEETPNGLRLRYDPKIAECIAQQAAEAPPDLWPMMDLLADLPTAVIRGENSDLLSRKTVDEIKARYPGIVTAEVRNRGHVPFLNEREALVAIHAVIDAVTERNGADTQN